MLDKSLSNLQFTVLIILMALVPIPKAGMMPWVLPIILFVGLAFCVITLIRSGAKTNAYQSEIKWLLPFLVVTIWLALQLFIMPQWLSWRALFADIELTGTFFADFNSSIDLISSLEWWGLFCVYWSIAWGVSKFSLRQAHHLMKLFFIVSFIAAVLALILHVSAQETVLGMWKKEAYINDATGTFVNRNHLANFLALCLPISLHYLLNIALPRHEKWRVFLLALATAYLLVVVATIVSSHSRMGFVAALLGVAVWLISAKTNKQDNQTMPRQYWGIGITAFVSLWLLWFGFTDLLERFLDANIGAARAEYRETVYSLPSIVWLFGIQPGAFGDVFMTNAPIGLNERITHAHSDYLQFFIEFGFLGTLLLLLSCLPLLKSLKLQQNRLVCAGVWGGVAVMLLHSTVDFSLHIPTNAIYFWVCIGLLLNPNLLENVSDKSRVTNANSSNIGLKVQSPPKPLKTRTNASQMKSSLTSSIKK